MTQMTTLGFPMLVGRENKRKVPIEVISFYVQVLGQVRNPLAGRGKAEPKKPSEASEKHRERLSRF